MLYVGHDRAEAQHDIEIPEAVTLLARWHQVLCWMRGLQADQLRSP